MEQGQSQDYRPEMPRGVRNAARAEMALVAIFCVVIGALMVAAPREHILWKYSWMGVEHVHRATGPGPKLIGLAVLSVIVTAFAVPLVYMLRGRMWAYYAAVLLNGCAVVTCVSDAIHGNFNLLGLLWLYVVWAFLGGFRQYREFARSRAARRT